MATRDCSRARGSGADRKVPSDAVKHPSDRDVHSEANVSRTMSSRDQAASLGLSGAGAAEAAAEAACEGVVETDALSSTSISC